MTPENKADSRYKTEVAQFFDHLDTGVVCTASGIRFDVINPTVDMINIEDIAHALAGINRFNGHTRRPYSVAQHSVLVSRIVEHFNPELAWWGLMHDAAEAYLGDIAAPIKRLVPDIKDLEIKLECVIAAKFNRNCAWFERPLIKDADIYALAIEQRDLMPATDWWAPLALPPELPASQYSAFLCWTFDVAKAVFVDRFRTVQGL